ncbi:MAG: hypothetical protein LBC02_06635 [Planctomycetaceae bacterium]|jgi:hypothetical protein|nr:hypothetical protein [Planctomycetaceae bacterium]
MQGGTQNSIGVIIVRNTLNPCFRSVFGKRYNRPVNLVRFFKKEGFRLTYYFFCVNFESDSIVKRFFVVAYSSESQ